MARSATYIQAALAVLLAFSCCAQDGSWMNEEVELNAARAMQERMVQVGLIESADSENQLSNTLVAVRAMRSRIEDWGLQAITQQAPALPGTQAPILPNPTVQAIARYGACGVSLYPELARTEDQRYFMVAGEFAVFLVAGFLRHQYLTEGGTDEQLESLLTSPELTQYSRQIQATQADVDRSLEACLPFFLKVIGQPDSKD